MVRTKAIRLLKNKLQETNNYFSIEEAKKIWEMFQDANEEKEVYKSFSDIKIHTFCLEMRDVAWEIDLMNENDWLSFTTSNLIYKEYFSMLASDWWKTNFKTVSNKLWRDMVWKSAMSSTNEINDNVLKDWFQYLVKTTNIHCNEQRSNLLCDHTIR